MDYFPFKRLTRFFFHEHPPLMISILLLAALIIFKNQICSSKSTSEIMMFSSVCTAFLCEYVTHSLSKICAKCGYQKLMNPQFCC